MRNLIGFSLAIAAPCIIMPLYVAYHIHHSLTHKPIKS